MAALIDKPYQHTPFAHVPYKTPLNAVPSRKFPEPSALAFNQQALKFNPFAPKTPCYLAPFERCNLDVYYPYDSIPPNYFVPNSSGRFDRNQARLINYECLDCLQIDNLMLKNRNQEQQFIQRSISAASSKNLYHNASFNADVNDENLLLQNNEAPIPQFGNVTDNYQTLPSNSQIPYCHIPPHNQSNVSSSRNLTPMEPADERTKLIKHVFANAVPISSFENNDSKFKDIDLALPFGDEGSADSLLPEKNLSHLEQVLHFQEEEMELRGKITESLTKALLDMPLDDYVHLIKTILDEVVKDTPS